MKIKGLEIKARDVVGLFSIGCFTFLIHEGHNSNIQLLLATIIVWYFSRRE